MLLIIISQYMETAVVSLAALTVLFALIAVEKSFRHCMASLCVLEKLTAWGSCVSRVTFASYAFPVIVRDADCLFSTGKVVRFTSTLCSYTIRKQEEKMCHK